MDMAAILRDAVIAFAHERENPHFERQIAGSRPSVIPFIGRRYRPRHLASDVRVLDAAVKKAYGGNAADRVEEVYAGEKANKLEHWLPDETSACREYSSRSRAAHDADRRRHPLAERRAAPDARSLRLPRPCAGSRACLRP
jgi:hypothetical protein